MSIPWGLRHSSGFERACVAWGTAYSRPAAGDEPQWLAWLASEGHLTNLRSEGLSPVALALTSELGVTDGDAAAPIRERLRQDALELSSRALMLELSVRKGLAALDEAGIRFAVIKGPAAGRFHQNPSLRAYRDIDIVVSRNQFVRAVTLLEQSGFRKGSAPRQPRQWFETVCVEGTGVSDGAVGSIDVHHRIAPWILSRELRPEEIVERSEQSVIGPLPVRMASPEDSLVIASLHVVNDLWKEARSLSSWRDVATIVTKLGVLRAASAFDRAGLAWFGELVMGGLVEGLGGHQMASDDRWAPAPKRRAGERALRWRLERIGWTNGPTRSTSRPGWGWRLPLPRAAAFAAGTVLPSKAYVMSGHGGYAAYWKQAVRSRASTPGEARWAGGEATESGWKRG